MKKEIIKFILVGCSNTVIGALLIYFFYNICGWGYWLASAFGYVVGSAWSYFMNKYFTFQYKKRDYVSVIRFIINIVVCYFIAYLIAKPLTMQICEALFPTFSEKMQEQIALLVGMGLFTVLNFIGQKFFCFTSKARKKDMQIGESGK